jgi:hypothetical protein
LYQAFAELGRVIRTVFLLEYLSSAELREQITASTNKVEAYHRFAKWLFFGGERLLLEIHPDEQEKRLKYNHLLTNAVAIQNVIDLTRAVRALIADGYQLKHEDLAALVRIRRGTSSASATTCSALHRRSRLTANWQIYCRWWPCPSTQPPPDGACGLFLRVSSAAPLDAKALNDSRVRMGGCRVRNLIDQVLTRILQER